MSDDYEAFAPFYESIGMAAFAEMVTPRVINFAQVNDWLGRRVIDLGSGTGASTRWLANQGYNTTGIDHSPAMLNVARKLASSNTGIALNFQEGDARAVADLHDVDLVLAFDLMNDLANLRELEMVLQSAANMLEPGKLLVFDLHTIEGMAKQDDTTHVIHDDDRMMVLQTQQFDYDRQMLTQSYTIFAAAAGEGDRRWTRHRAARTLRGFPVPAVLSLLGRTGFSLMAVVTPTMQPIEPSTREARVIVFARR